MKQKVLSILALLMMTATGAWAQASMLETPLTLEALTDGTIMVNCISTLPNEMKYSVNGGAKTAFTTTTTIEGLKAGDKVQFYGNNGNGQGRAWITGGTAQVKAYGNVMSVLSETGFENATTISETYALYGLFRENNTLTDAGDLLLPATILNSSCYSFMFYRCTALTAAPELPAMTLAYGCYASMFSGCTSLNSVTCLATDISASYATNLWLNNVAATGTLIKAAGMTGWEDGPSGIPSGWTTLDNVTLNDGNDLSALLTYKGQSCAVTYKRTFTAGKASTVCLPFAYAPKTGEHFYTFTGIEQKGNEYVATMTEEAGATLAANKPYLYMPSGDTDFSGTYAIPADIKAGTTPNGDWTFVGTYEANTWDGTQTGIYGFSGVSQVGIEQGQFVKVGTGVSIAPMRCYLKYKGGEADYQAAPQLGRRAGSELPQSIRVRLVNANGEVTSIGEEISVKREDAAAAGWYMLDGRKLSGTPTQKGIYIVNGKKVVIK